MNTWFRYFLAKAISQRRGRFILSSAAVTLSVSVVTALATVSLGVREKIGAELKQYGANMIVTHQEGAPIGQDTAAAVRALSPAVKDASFQLYDTAAIGEQSVEIIGAEPGKMTGIRIYGRLPSGTGEAMVGVNPTCTSGCKTISGAPTSCAQWPSWNRMLGAPRAPASCIGRRSSTTKRAVTNPVAA